MPLPNAQPVDDSHPRLMLTLDLMTKPKPFRNTAWRPSQRRNKNVKQIISEAARREQEIAAAAAAAATDVAAQPVDAPNNSAAIMHTETTQINGQRSQHDPAKTNGTLQANVAIPAGAPLDETISRGLQTSLAEASGQQKKGPVATYTNIESAPSLHPGEKRRYCDITGLPAEYTDPKTRLRYANKEVFNVIRSLPQGSAERYLEARGAQVILK